MNSIFSVAERLHATLVPCVRAVSESVWELSRAQQFASLSERQRSIVGTQGRYRKVVQLSLQLRDKKKRLREQRDALHREMQVEASLAKALAGRAQVARQKILAAVAKIHHETVQEEKREPEVNRHAEFEALIKELENEVFHKKDLKEELGQIASDQVSYKKALDEEEKKRKMLREKLLSMAQVAEMVLGRTSMTQEPTVSSPNPSEQSEFLEKMSTILLETTKAEGEPESERDFRNEKFISSKIIFCNYFLGNEGCGGLVVRSRPCGQRDPGSKPDSTEDPSYMGPAAR
ncbi:hypothetical protein AVEN_4926-1 [Araneus ventricosus]|uniref:Uncharacterized protein n=1 Tax=Araneus ventricosus TaxID=182803 RepID=A0A4Y2RGC7_ARAVE|nr:hypothetical protein AVEN_4926-1 [Araneus ventricosus]